MARLRESAMKCEEMDELMPDYLKGKLNSDRALRVEAWLRNAGSSWD